ncbi:hypothetical protein Rsub_13088 [Raphidocelis subcapitata]|uniref:Glycoside hydrolase n=1 Tax=Raphidocelis subcapitata TaxID=307507 RepID=A0A2V0PSM5_9CHLO|nr:hypothetical protein Rsub_13088 [Raphidocelis subcapitata]|eukprot:GBG00356.1 hypothetical protein Rsub_13088 [Raphidocelis subcapitata]
MRPLLAAALAAAAALLLAAPAPAAAAVAEFVPSVVMTNFGEMGGPCFSMVDKAASLNANSIKFVPTVHYWGSADRIDKYCYRDESWNCVDATPDTMRRYRDLLSSCIKHAVSKGLDVAILAHLDNMREYTWRNLLQFDPTAQYGGASYADVVLRPMADAVNQAVGSGTNVIFTINGETGKSVSQYANSWLALVPTVRSWLMAGGRMSRDKAQVAVSLNYNKLHGWISLASIDPNDIAAGFDKAWKEQSPGKPIDNKGMKALYDAVDVIGVSAYPPLYVGFKMADLNKPIEMHANELAYSGINLKSLLDSGKKLVISEWGVGGGTQDGFAVAPSVNYVAQYPFFGLWYPYADYKNPWKRSDYNDYRKYLYRMTADYLSNGGGTYPIDKVYVWTAGSWDALGVHFQSSDGSGSWADNEIIDLVKNHNSKV